MPLLQESLALGNFLRGKGITVRHGAQLVVDRPPECQQIIERNPDNGQSDIQAAVEMLPPDGAELPDRDGHQAADSSGKAGIIPDFLYKKFVSILVSYTSLISIYR